MKKISYRVEFRNLTEEEYKEAPEDVRKMYISASKTIPLPEAEKHRIITEYPEYFTKVPERGYGQNVKRMMNLKSFRNLQKKKAGKKARKKALIMARASFKGTHPSSPELAEKLKSLTTKNQKS